MNEQEVGKIACYVRVSSAGQNSTSQKRAVNRWLRGHGHDPAEVQWFEDVESGAKAERPGLAALKSAIFHGEVTMVVIYKIDRLSRSLRHGIELLGEWTDQGVRVVSVTQEIDLGGPVGRLVASVLLSLAEIERQHIRERQAAGIEVAKAAGKYTGRKAGTTKAKPARAVALREKGHTIKEVATALGVSPATVKRYCAAAT